MSMIQVVAAAAADFIPSLGVELCIFCITLLVALIVRGLPASRGMSPCAKALQEESVRDVRKRSGAVNNRSAKNVKDAVESQQQAMAHRVDTMLRFARSRQSTEAIAMYEALSKCGEKAVLSECIASSEIKERHSLLVHAAGVAGRPDVIDAVFDGMICAGIGRSFEFYETCMKMLAGSKCFKDAVAVFRKMEVDGLEPTPTTLSCLVSWAVESGQKDQAIEYFHRLAARTTPSIRAYMNIFRVHSKRANWSQSLALLRDAQSREVPIDTVALNVVLNTGMQALASGKIDELSAVKELLDEFAQKGTADLISYNTLMKGYAHNKDADKAIDVLNSMQNSGFAPNQISFNTCMDACVRGGKVAAAWALLVRMLNMGLAPDRYSCTTLMKGLQCGATSDQVSVILDILKTVTPDCDETLKFFMFRSVNEAVAKLNDLELNAKAVAQLREQRETISSANYHRLLKVLMQTSNPDKL